jgi:hypothetical protein
MKNREERRGDESEKRGRSAYLLDDGEKGVRAVIGGG